MNLLWFISLTHQRRFLQRVKHVRLNPDPYDLKLIAESFMLITNCDQEQPCLIFQLSAWIITFKGRLNTDTSPQNFWTTFLENDFIGTIKEKRSGKRNRDTCATVLFLFRSVMPVPRKQTILFLSLSHPAVLRR